MSRVPLFSLFSHVRVRIPPIHSLSLYLFDARIHSPFVVPSSVNFIKETSLRVENFLRSLIERSPFILLFFVRSFVRFKKCWTEVRTDSNVESSYSFIELFLFSFSSYNKTIRNVHRFYRNFHSVLEMINGIYLNVILSLWLNRDE